MSPQDKSDLDLLVSANLEITETTQVSGGTAFIVTGDTHPFRHLLREAGGKWNALDRVWVFSGDDPGPALAKTLRSHPFPSSAPKNEPKKPHYHGHRERLRKRFMQASANSLADYELLELLLFQCIPRIDVKPIAKQLLETFGSLGGVMAADINRLSDFPKISYATLVHLKALYELSQRIAHEQIDQQPVLGSWDKLLAYLKTSMAHESTERFHVLFLNAKNVLIADEVQQVGTVNHTPVYPREVIKRALDVGATALILVHNHPSGDPTPSSADIEMTKAIAAAGEKLDIVLHDHIIMSKNGYTSFRDLGLI